MGNNIYLSDAIAIYCLDKITGKVVWARTGMRDDRELELKKSWKDEKAATGSSASIKIRSAKRIQ